MNQEVSDYILFFGRFHPLIVHLPIGFLIIALILEGLSPIKRFRLFEPVIGFVLLLGTMSSIIAAIMGFMLAQAGGYDEQLLFIHQWAGITLAIFTLLAFLLKTKLQKSSSNLLNKAYITVLVVIFIGLTAAGHYGGSLTHGSDYLMKYAPNGLRMVAGLSAKEEVKKITNINEAVVFTDIVFPILDTKCNSCHNASKSKGDLMMHDTIAFLKGGEGGTPFLAGNANKSIMIENILLPQIDDKHMPPKGKTQLTDEEIKLITWWIDEGASFHKKAKSLKIPEEVQIILKTMEDPNAFKSAVDLLLASGVKAADAQMIAQLQKKAMNVMFVANDANWLQAKILPGYSADSLVNNLTKVSEQLTWLDLKRTTTTDKALVTISQFKNLTRLYLDNTMITDNGLKHLKSLSYLEYLNLFGTKISDKGIRQLSGLKNLRKLYLLDTQVSKNAVSELKRALPLVEVYFRH